MRRFRTLSPLYYAGVMKPVGAVVELDDHAARRLMRMGVVEEVGEDESPPAPAPEPVFIPKLVKPRKGGRSS